MSPETPDYETTVAEPKLPLSDRPAEVGSFVLLLPSVYGALTAIDVPPPWCWIIAVLVAAGPLVISWARDGKTDHDDPGDHDPEDGPLVEAGDDEQQGLDHSYPETAE